MCEVISGEQRALLQKGRKPETRLKLKEFVACQTVANVELETSLQPRRRSLMSF